MASKQTGRPRAGNPKTVETLTHDEARRKNIPTAEYQSVMQKGEPRRSPVARMAVGIPGWQTPVRRVFESPVRGHPGN